jgi:hypothetical protein
MYVDVPDVEQSRAILGYYGGRYGGVDVERVLDEVKGGFSGAEVRIAFEDCIVDGCDVSTEGVIANLRRLREMKEKVSGKKFGDYNAGWSKAMDRIRTRALARDGRAKDEQ